MPTWDTLLKADAAEPGSKGAVRFAEYARTAWGTVEPRIAELLGEGGGAGPVLLTEARCSPGTTRWVSWTGSRRRPGGAGGACGSWPPAARPVSVSPGSAGGRAVPGGPGGVDSASDTWVGSAHRGSGGVAARAAVERRREVIDRKALLDDLKRQVKAVEADLARQVKALGEVGARLKSEYDRARKLGRTAATWNSWLDERVTQVAVAWVLGTVFVRFCEDNRLIPEPYLTGPDGDRRELAESRYDAYVESDEDPTYRGWLEKAFDELGQGQAGGSSSTSGTIRCTRSRCRTTVRGSWWSSGEGRGGRPRPRLHGPAERGRYDGLGHAFPGRPVPGPERGRPEDVRAAPDAGVRGGVHPRPDDGPGGTEFGYEDLKMIDRPVGRGTLCWGRSGGWCGCGRRASRGVTCTSGCGPRWIRCTVWTSTRSRWPLRGSGCWLRRWRRAGVRSLGRRRGMSGGSFGGGGLADQAQVPAGGPVRRLERAGCG